MEEIAEDVLRKAETEARKMLASETTLGKVLFGQGGGALWIASDRSLVVVDRVFTVDGREFYLGLFRK